MTSLPPLWVSVSCQDSFAQRRLRRGSAGSPEWLGSRCYPRLADRVGRDVYRTFIWVSCTGYRRRQASADHRTFQVEDEAAWRGVLLTLKGF